MNIRLAFLDIGKIIIAFSDVFFWKLLNFSFLGVPTKLIYNITPKQFKFLFKDELPLMNFCLIFPFIFVSSCFLFSAEKKVDFAREVLPVLSNKCFACHGPDTQKKDLVRLDTEDLAKKDLGGYLAIDPIKLEESELLFRIADEDDPMPPI